MAKSKSNYWEDRATDNFQEAEKAIENRQEEIIKIFEEAQRKVEDQIKDFYFRYSTNNNISYADAQKLLSLDELKKFRGSLEDFEKLAKESVGTFNLELENLSMKSRMTRLQALNGQISGVINNAYTQMNTMITETASEVFADQYYKTLFDIDQYYGVHFNFANLSDEAIKEALEVPLEGVHFSDRIWRQQQDLNYRLKKSISECILAQNDPSKLSKQFSKDFGVKRYEAYRLLYTEVSSVQSDATLQGYIEDGIDEYENIATLDSKTSEICQEMNGKVFKVSEAKKGINYPPYHPWCRTTTGAKIKTLKDIDEKRIARDKDNKNIDVPGNMTYPEWKSKYIDSVSLNITSDSTISSLIEPISSKQVTLKAYKNGEQIVIDERILEACKEADLIAENRLPLASKYITGFTQEGNEIMSIKTNLLSKTNDPDNCYIRMLFNFGENTNDFDKVVKEIQDSIKIGKFYKGQDTVGIFLHEYTHAHLQAYTFDKLGINLAKTNMAEWKLWNEECFKLCERIVSEAISKYPNKYRDFEKEIGYYAIKNGSSECIPQCVSKYYTVGSENDILKEIVKKVEELK